MSPTSNTTTLVCLFHHDDQARAALNDLEQAGIPRSALTTITKSGNQNATFSSLESTGIPDRDLKHLQEGVNDGGTVIAVSAIANHVGTVERIFSNHSATKIDETVADDRRSEAAVPVAGAPRAPEGGVAVPVVEEQLQVGKRTVDQGGVRVYRRVVEVPAETSINLREEHVVVERNALNRPATQQDMDAQGDRSFELIETAEEAVVSKSAHVTEEVVVNKVVGEHTEHIRDTVRKTEVEVEQLSPAETRDRPNGSR